MKNFRIILAGDGKYYVEKMQRKKTFFSPEVWECIMFYAGLDKPFGYKTFDGAMKDLLSEIEKETIKNSRQFIS